MIRLIQHRSWYEVQIFYVYSSLVQVACPKMFLKNLQSSGKTEFRNRIYRLPVGTQFKDDYSPHLEEC